MLQKASLKESDLSWINVNICQNYNDWPKHVTKFGIGDHGWLGFKYLAGNEIGVHGRLDASCGKSCPQSAMSSMSPIRVW